MTLKSTEYRAMLITERGDIFMDRPSCRELHEDKTTHPELYGGNTYSVYSLAADAKEHHLVLLKVEWRENGVVGFVRKYR